jgi:hypothetical protein
MASIMAVKTLRTALKASGTAFTAPSTAQNALCAAFKTNIRKRRACMASSMAVTTLRTAFKAAGTAFTAQSTAQNAL